MPLSVEDRFANTAASRDAPTTRYFALTSGEPCPFLTRAVNNASSDVVVASAWGVDADPTDNDGGTPVAFTPGWNQGRYQRIDWTGGTALTGGD